MKDIGRRLPWMLPGSTGYLSSSNHSHISKRCLATALWVSSITTEHYLLNKDVIQSDWVPKTMPWSTTSSHIKTLLVNRLQKALFSAARMPYVALRTVASHWKHPPCGCGRWKHPGESPVTDLYPWWGTYVVYGTRATEVSCCLQSSVLYRRLNRSNSQLMYLHVLRSIWYVRFYEVGRYGRTYSIASSKKKKNGDQRFTLFSTCESGHQILARWLILLASHELQQYKECGSRYNTLQERRRATEEGGKISSDRTIDGRDRSSGAIDPATINRATERANGRGHATD